MQRGIRILKEPISDNTHHSIFRALPSFYPCLGTSTCDVCSRVKSLTTSGRGSITVYDISHSSFMEFSKLLFDYFSLQQGQLVSPPFYFFYWICAFRCFCLYHRRVYFYHISLADVVLLLICQRPSPLGTRSLDVTTMCTTSRNTSLKSKASMKVKCSFLWTTDDNTNRRSATLKMHFLVSVNILKPAMSSLFITRATVAG